MNLKTFLPLFFYMINAKGQTVKYYLLTTVISGLGEVLSRSGLFLNSGPNVIILRTFISCRAVIAFETPTSSVGE